MKLNEIYFDQYISYPQSYPLMFLFILKKVIHIFRIDCLKPFKELFQYSRVYEIKVQSIFVFAKNLILQFPQKCPNHSHHEVD